MLGSILTSWEALMMLVTCPGVTWGGVINAFAGGWALLVGGEGGRPVNSKAGFEPVT